MRLKVLLMVLVVSIGLTGCAGFDYLEDKDKKALEHHNKLEEQYERDCEWMSNLEYNISKQHFDFRDKELPQTIDVKLSVTNLNNRSGELEISPVKLVDAYMWVGNGDFSVQSLPKDGFSYTTAIKLGPNESKNTTITFKVESLPVYKGEYPAIQIVMKLSNSVACPARENIFFRV